MVCSIYHSLSTNVLAVSNEYKENNIDIYQALENAVHPISFVYIDSHWKLHCCSSTHPH